MNPLLLQRLLERQREAQGANMLPELDLTPAAMPPIEPSRLRDDEPEPAAPPVPPAREEWALPPAAGGPPSAPPLVEGEDEMSRRLRAHLERRLAATEAEPTTGQKIGGILMGLGGDYAGQRRAFHPGETDAGVSQEVAAYLATRGREVSAADAAAARARDSEARAKLAEDRLAMDQTFRQTEAERRARELELREWLTPSLIEQREANVALKGALTRKAAAQAKAAAAGPPLGTTTDINFDGSVLAYNRPNPNKVVSQTNQKEVYDKAADWSQVVAQSEALADAIEQWANAPSIEARNRVRQRVLTTAQDLTVAIGGGAMQEAERKAAIDALGGDLADYTQVLPFVRGLLGSDSTEQARIMAERARELRPMAHRLIKAFADPRGYDVRPSAPPQPQEAPPPLDQPATPGAAAAPTKVAVTHLATGRTIMLAPEVAAKAEKEGKVRRQ
jgi:hypothetical protein